MQGIGQLLASSLLLLSLLGVLAQNSGTVAHNSQPDSKVRVTSSAVTSSESSGSSSGGGGGAADNTHAAAKAPTNTFPQPFRFPVSLAVPSSNFAYLPIFRGQAYKQYPSSNLSRPPAHQPLPSSNDEDTDEAEKEAEVTAEEQNVANVGDKQSTSSHRLRRGAYNAPYFVGKRSLEETGGFDQEDFQRQDLSSEELNDDLPEEVQEALQDLQESDMLVGKRRAPMFVGKRKLAPLFVGRREESYLTGKRGAPMFVGKRDPPTVVSRASPMFVGRSAPMFVGRRQAPMFVGKRRAPLFIGKRAAPMFVGKRPSPMFVGKRPSPMFVGKRPSPMFVGKRPSPMFVGKRPSPMFVGKRPSPMFVGKRPSPMFVGKRPSPMFVGKREEEDLNELLAALKTLQRARHYRRMIQADKRHNAPFFVGRRSSPPTQDTTQKTPQNTDPSTEWL